MEFPIWTIEHNELHEPYEPKLSESPSFKVKSTWKSPIAHPNLDVFLGQVEKVLFKMIETPLRDSKLPVEVPKTIH